MNYQENPGQPPANTCNSRECKHKSPAKTGLPKDINVPASGEGPIFASLLEWLSPPPAKSHHRTVSDPDRGQKEQQSRPPSKLAPQSSSACSSKYNMTSSTVSGHVPPRTRASQITSFFQARALLLSILALRVPKTLLQIISLSSVSPIRLKNKQISIPNKLNHRTQPARLLDLLNLFWCTVTSDQSSAKAIA